MITTRRENLSFYLYIIANLPLYLGGGGATLIFEVIARF